MRVVILAGGKGTRLGEETTVRPKPMLEIGGRPLLWHIMNLYAHHGHRDFIVACGYLGGVIKQYFHDFSTQNNDYFVDLSDGSKKTVQDVAVDWRVGVIDTGLETATGGRLRRLRRWIGDQTFMATYRDGVGDINIASLQAFHRSHGRLATVTAVRPPARFGALTLDRDAVVGFSEKPQNQEGWINGGFFVFEPAVLDYIESDATSLEHEPLRNLCLEGQLAAYRHEGFWQPMDTRREKDLLQSLWDAGEAPWKVWE